MKKWVTNVIIIAVFILVIGGFVTWTLMSSNVYNIDFNKGNSKSLATLSFKIDQNDNPIDGEILVDGNSLGNTYNGKFTIPSTESAPKQFSFKGEYNQIEFEFVYDFPEDYKKYSILEFVISKKDLDEYAELSNQKLPQTPLVSIKDEFPYNSKPHWYHMPVTYQFDSALCRDDRTQKLLKAFEEIRNKTNGKVSFVESSNPDITINCKQNPYTYTGMIQTNSGAYFMDVLGTGRINYYLNNMIINATINLYPSSNSCGYFPLVEIHEILHVFGYGHSNNTCSIMYSGENSCRFILENPDICGKPRIDDRIATELIATYTK